MNIISKDKVIYAMDKNNSPVLSVDSNEVVVFETMDCFSDQITSANDKIDTLNWNHINPATGPLFINDAKVGDILKIEILEININDKGVMMTGPNLGVMGSYFKQSTIKIIDIEDDVIKFNDEVEISINKMIGVIGTAPKDESVSCGTPDLHGGNMDCKEIKEGATIYLPVNVDGALLAMGDLHAAMADGEVSVSGLEVCGSVKVKVEVIKNKQLLTPMIENDNTLICLYSDEDLNVAVDRAVENMANLLVSDYGFNISDATMLLSLVGDVRICQVVDPKKTVRVEIDKKYLTS
jgi:amidase